LREAGDAKVSEHLAQQKGRRHAVLMENPRMGRTEQFTEVAFDTDLPESAIITADIIGRIGQQLTGQPVS